MKQSIDFVGKNSDEAGGIAKHNDRVAEFNVSNEMIRSELSNQNVTLVKNKVQKEIQKIKTKKITGGLQAKTQTFTGFVIQAGNKEEHLTREKALEYFEESVQFLKDKFGPSKICQATVHFDETTPHLHVVVSNLVRDTKNKKYYCSSGRAWGITGLTKTQVRKSAKAFELKFYDEVSKKYGFEAPARTLGTKGKQTKKEWEAIEKVKEMNKVMGKAVRIIKRQQKELEEFKEPNKTEKEVQAKELKKGRER